MITFISIWAKLFPRHPLGPPLKMSETSCCFSLYSSFSHLYGINSRGFSNKLGLWRNPIQMALQIVPFTTGTPPKVESVINFLSKSPFAGLTILDISNKMHSRYGSFLRLLTVISESDFITELIYFLSLSTIRGC